MAILSSVVSAVPLEDPAYPKEGRVLHQCVVWDNGYTDPVLYSAIEGVLFELQEWGVVQDYALMKGVSELSSFPYKARWSVYRTWSLRLWGILSEVRLVDLPKKTRVRWLAAFAGTVNGPQAQLKNLIKYSGLMEENPDLSQDLITEHDRNRRAKTVNLARAYGATNPTFKIGDNSGVIPPGVRI